MSKACSDRVEFCGSGEAFALASHPIASDVVHQRRMDSCSDYAPLTNAATPLVLVTVTTANISSLVTVLAAILLYTDIGPRTEIRKVMVLAFSVGMCSLVLCIVLFSASILIVPPKYCD